MKRFLLFTIVSMLAAVNYAGEVVMTFDDPTVYGYAKPDAGKYTQVANGGTLSLTPIEISAAFTSGSGLRFFANTNTGVVNLRIYKDASFIIATTDGSKISSIVFEGSNLGSSYISATGYDGTDTWSGSETSVTFNCIKSTIQINKVTITTAASGALASPTFKPAAGEYYGPQTITLSGPTDAKIFYSTDNTNFTEYTEPFVLNASATVYAYSRKGETASETVSATYTIKEIVKYTTISDLSAACTATAQKDAPTVELQMENYVVTFVSGQNTYITSNGTDGFLIYGTNTTFTAGKKLTGTIQGKLYSYNGLKELAITDAWANVQAAEELADVTAQEKTIANILQNTDALESVFIALNEVNFEANALTSKAVTIMDEDGDEISLYDNFGVLAATSFNTTDKYNITGFPARRGENVNFYVASIEAIPSAVDAPTFNIESGTFEENQTVVISAPGAARILYTLDGTDPTPQNASSKLYEQPILIEQTTTIKAIAYNNSGQPSNIATLVVTIDKPITTIADLYTACTATKASEAPTVTFKFEDLLVTGAKNSNVYVSDGSKAFLIYGSSSNLVKGDIISGKIAGKLYAYNGLSELAVSDAFKDVVIKSQNNDVSASTHTVAEILADYKALESQYVNIENVTFGATAVASKNVTITDATGSVTLRDNFGILTSQTFDTQATYTVKAYVLNYNGTAQLYPIAVEDIVKNIPDAINGIKAQTVGKKGIYTIQGQKVETIANKGIYIIDGKKIFVR